MNDTPRRYMVVTHGHPRYEDGLKLGVVTLSHDGWRLTPYTQDAPSRRGWPTPQDAAKRLRHFRIVDEQLAQGAQEQV